MFATRAALHLYTMKLAYCRAVRQDILDFYVRNIVNLDLQCYPPRHSALLCASSRQSGWLWAEPRKTLAQSGAAVVLVDSRADAATYTRLLDTEARRPARISLKEPQSVTRSALLPQRSSSAGEGHKWLARWAQCCAVHLHPRLVCDRLRCVELIGNAIPGTEEHLVGCLTAECGVG